MPIANPAHPRPWHKGSIFGDGPRLKMDRERRAVWKARIEFLRLAGQITDGFAQVGLALLKRLGQDGRCDPSHATLADYSGESVSTVKRALEAFRRCGMVSWARRILRDGWRAVQTSNAYMLTLGETPKIPVLRCKAQFERETKPLINQRLTCLAAEEEAARQSRDRQLGLLSKQELLGKVERVVL